MKIISWFKDKALLYADDRTPDYYLLYTASFLMIVGMIFSYSLSIYTVDYYDYSQFHFFLRQGIVVLFSILLMWVFAHIKPSVIFKDWKLGIKIFIFSGLLLVFMKGLPASMVTESGGAARWIRLGPISISPVEFVKIGFIYILARSFHKRFSDSGKLTLKQETKEILPYLGFLGFLAIFIAVMQKDLGNTVLLGVVMLFMMYFAERSLKILFLIVTFSITAFITLVAIAPHRVGRIKSWWSSVQDSYLEYLPPSMQESLRVTDFDEPYQVNSSLSAINNGGFFGQGLAEGNMKLGFLSEVHTDFVLAGILEEVGFFGFLFILGLIIFVIIRLFKISRRVKNQVHHYFVLGIGLMISFELIINSFGITGMIPIKGIAVPFLSYGGSQILALGLALGMVLSISKEVDEVPNKALEDEDDESLRY